MKKQEKKPFSPNSKPNTQMSNPRKSRSGLTATDYKNAARALAFWQDDWSIDIIPGWHDDNNGDVPSEKFCLEHG